MEAVKARAKSSSWLYSKGFSEKDVQNMYASLDNAQKLFTGLQGAYSGMSAETVFSEYMKQIKGGHAVNGVKPIGSFEETQPYIDRKNRQKNNVANADKIIELLATKTKSYEHIKSEVLSNISQYGSQKFMEQYNYGYYLSSNSTAKQVDDLVRNMVDENTGEPLYRTSSVSDIFHALIVLNDKYEDALSKAAQGEKTVSGSINKVGGFSKGGIIDTSTLSRIAEKNGDDAWVTVKSGEGFLSPLDTQNLQQLTQTLRETKYGVPNDISMGGGITNKPIPNQNINAGNMYGDVSIHLDGSNIRDFKTFREELGNAVKHDKKTRDIISTTAIGALTDDPNAFYHIC